MAHTKNKTKYWRRASETFMNPQEITSKDAEGNDVTEVVDVPFELTGRNLKMYHQQGGNMKPLASTLLINLINNAGFVTIENDESDANVPSDLIETPMETATV